MRRLPFLLPLLLLVGCSSAVESMPAAPAAAAVAEPPEATEPAAAVEAADDYWSAARMRALEEAKRKFRAPRTKPEAEVAAGSAVATGAEAVPAGLPEIPPAPAPAPAPEALPVVAPGTVEPVTPAEPKPVPTAPPAGVVRDGKIADKDFFAFLREMVWAVEHDLITVKGLRLVLEDAKDLDLTRRQRRVLKDLTAEVDKVIAKGPQPSDDRWVIEDVKLPRQLQGALPLAETDFSLR